MSTATQALPITIDEYTRLYAADGPFEIIDGERKPLMPPVMIHVLTVQALLFALKQHCDAHDAGRVFSETPFVLQYDQNWVQGARVPDLMFIAAARWQQYVQSTPDWKSKPILLVPDFVVEVVSKHDLYTELQNKVDHYLRDGVRMVWVIDPNRQHAAVYSGNQYTPLTADDTLTGGELLPNFTIPLQMIFDVE